MIREEILNSLVSISPPIFNNEIVYDYVKRDATLEQLWTLHKWVLFEKNFKVLSIRPGDHMALISSDMYVAILPDGSIHT